MAVPKSSPQDRPELRAPGISTQLFAESMARKEAEETHKPLIRRVGVLRLAVAVLLLSTGELLYKLLPQLWQGSILFDTVVTPLQAFNAIVQLAAAGYLLVGTDPDFAASIIKLMLILNGLELVMGLSFSGPILLMLINIVLLFLAHQRLRQLCKHWF